MFIDLFIFDFKKNNQKNKGIVMAVRVGSLVERVYLAVVK